MGIWTLARQGGIRVPASALVLASLALVFLPDAPASAFSCGRPGTYHDGYFTTPAKTHLSFTGNVAVIDIQSARLCKGGKDQFTNVWEMLSSDARASNIGWAQAGYEYQPGKGIRDFAQTINGAPPVATYYSKTSLHTSATRTYASRINKACGFCIVNSVNGKAVQIDYAGTEGWAAPYSIQYSAEARYSADDIVGISTNKTRLSHLRYQGSDYVRLRAVPCKIFTAASSSSRWKHQSIGCAKKQLWTDPTN